MRVRGITQAVLLVGGLLAACVSDQPTDPGPDAGSDAGSSCTPKTCPERLAECGTVPDGCGKDIDCGSCVRPNDACQANECVCVPRTCADGGYECGQWPDGCGGTMDCGTAATKCTDPQKPNCSGGQCSATPCTPKTMSDACAGLQCGQVSDGCSSTYDCGQCTSPDTCGGGGQANQCGCTPKTCTGMGWQCGTGNETGCNTALDCGGCATGFSCWAHKCQDNGGI